MNLSCMDYRLQINSVVNLVTSANQKNWEVYIMKRLLTVVTVVCVLFLAGVSVLAQEHAVDLRFDFSDGLSGWYVFGEGVLNVTSAQARSENNSLIMSYRSDGWHSAAIGLNSFLADGGTYQFSIYVRLVSDSEEEIFGHLTMGQNYRDGSAEYTWLCEDVLLSSDEWVLIESEPYYYDASNLEYLWLYVEISEISADYYIDDFRIVGDK